MLFDSHCHLNDPEMIDNIEEYILNAKNNGVTKMAVIGYDLDSSIKAVEIAKAHEGVYAVVGIIPNEINRIKKGDIEKIEALLDEPKVVAVGEIGLDYYNEENVDHDLQKQVFELFIKMAYKHGKPFTVHSRDAANDTYELLKKNKQYITKGIIHCYSYSQEMTKQFIDLGFYISLAGPVTFKNAKEPKLVASSVPLNKLLIETDSPYLTPVPNRGKKNEPANVRYTCACIAELRNISVEEVAKATYENAMNVYGIKD